MRSSVNVLFLGGPNDGLRSSVEYPPPRVMRFSAVEPPATTWTDDAPMTRPSVSTCLYTLQNLRGLGGNFFVYAPEGTDPIHTLLNGYKVGLAWRDRAE